MECIWDTQLLQRVGELPDELLEAIRNSHCSPEQYLSLITQTALDPRYTYTLLAHCQNLLPHICADLRRYGSLPQALATLGRLVSFAPFLSPYAQELLAKETPNYTAQTDSAHDLLFLLGVYRLLRHDHRTFSPLVDAQAISMLLNSNQRPIVYMAIRILQILLSGADAWFEQMMKRYLGDDSAENTIDGQWDDLIIDYRFLSLWEEERYERVQELVRGAQETVSPVSTPTRILPADCFHPSCRLVGGVLLPAFQSNKVASRLEQNLVATLTVSANLQRIANGLRSSSPLLLTGLAGAGKTLLVRHAAMALGELDSLVTLHLNEQSDAKLLIGVYTTGDTPGSFSWRPGVLTTAVQEGRWVFIEDLDRAPQEIIGALLPLIERGELAIPNRKQVIQAKQGFRIIATVRSTLNHRGEETRPLSHMLGRRHWNDVPIAMPPTAEQSAIASQLFPIIQPHLPQFVAVFDRLHKTRQTAVPVGQAKTGILRPISPRDLLKWCRRVTNLLHGRSSITSSDIDDFFLEAMDCFVGALPDGEAKLAIAAIIAEELRIDPQRRDFLLIQREVRYMSDKNRISMGRYALTRSTSSRASQTQSSFSTNPHTSRMLERVAAAVINMEPLLLVGETGVGKTTAVQHLANHLSKKLVPFNLSQQSEAGDLIGGFKPVNARSLMVSLKDEFDDLFPASFSQAKNQQYLDMIGKRMARGQWKAVCKLFHHALEMVDQQRAISDTRQGEAPTKKRKVEAKKPPDFIRWDAFAEKVKEMDHRLKAGNEFFAFSFVEGNIVKAVRNGDWILLDEINLASSDTLESIADLLDPSAPSVLLTEAGNVERIDAHPDFRVFAAMNPATDVGKKDLPPGIRSRFTELYVESPDKDIKSLQSIVRAYLRTEAAADQAVALDVSTLYQQIIGLSEQNKLVDGAGQKPHFSLRTLTRTLSYVRHIAPMCSLRRALYEGFQMSFLTYLDAESSNLVQPLLENQLFGKRINVRSELKKALRKPADGHEYAQGYPGSKHWVRQGRRTPQEQEHYIITPFIRNNLENLVRASSTRQFPVLIQGPTSSGKTSMIEYLAKRTGHRFVRINNHEHTDLQEYFGTYVSGADGRLQFQEGVLVQALREGHWLVLDELNLAPTDVLEALNRLLDDNRELLIPETQEIVRPHEDFMLFATQNPAGLYGGRKALSRAFRNRFLELHFDDIPVDELQEILHKRTQLPESRCKRIVSVYRELSVLRQENRLFEQKSFATLRDLFRWALRQNDTIDQLAANGFMLLAERVRKPEEREAVKGVIEKVMSLNGPRVKIDETALYSQQCAEIQQHHQHASHQGAVWTSAMRRLYTLVSRAIANNEPVLLVGETGCGKTTVCQMLADALSQDLHIINAHQNTETGDLIGSQRPVRNRAAIETQLNQQLDVSPLMQYGEGIVCHTMDARISLYESASRGALGQSIHESRTAEQEHQEILANIARYKALFEWADGSLVSAMRKGAFFLLDEISLADDSVLERLNSVLEPSRSILLAEKGSLDSFVKAQDGFQFFATMNPGGDYGKRELSPALRNRFTEIWVPALSDLDDVVQIVQGKLSIPAHGYAKAMVDFAHWFKDQFNTSASSSVSIRDVLAWSQFVNAFAQSDLAAGIVHGAAMVYIDTLGANPAGLMTLTGQSLDDERESCIKRLGALLDTDASAIYRAPIKVTIDDRTVTIGPFAIQRNPTTPLPQSAFSFDAPTTRANAMRVMRAMQLSKPIMLEGSPGVGKTALVTAIADAAGVPLTRINLSEQTDLMDLFGSDAPVQGAKAGTFAWRDAPFLRAMKKGEWVLLDEMNLASQSVLEGLNACLDHRGEVYVPEIGETFSRHPEFRLFAAQNPHHQGGGRKGLPASFVNRFTVVYADSFRSEDLMLICQRAFPAADAQTVQQAVSFVELLDVEVAQRKRFGALGGPWEFNLRDISRWLSLVNSEDGLLKAGNAKDFVDLLFTQRFRTAIDRACVEDIFTSVYGADLAPSDLHSSLSVSTVQLGLSLLTRNSLDAPTHPRPISEDGVGHHLHALQAMMMGVQRSWPMILSGSSGVGKSSIIESLASAIGATVETFAMNAETDAMDLVGGYEQADPLRDVSRKLEEFILQQTAQAREGLFKSTIQDPLYYAAEVRRLKAAAALDSTKIKELAKYLNRLSVARELATTVQEAAQATDKASFVWIDGTLVDAMQQGKWLVLDNANLCSPSVLDRLNSLLEPNGTLIINEHVGEDGAPRVIHPHPNFRIFLTVDPRYGELSRAMRNRTLEVHMLERGGNKWLVDPLQPESAMMRFRKAKALGVVNLSAATAARAPLLLHDSIGLIDEVLLARFGRQVTKGLYNGLNSPEQQQVAQIDSASKSVMRHEQFMALYESAVSGKQVSADFARVQTFHPLNNQPLVQQSDDTMRRAMRLAFLYKTHREAHHLVALIQRMQLDRTIVSKLMRMERGQSTRVNAGPASLTLQTLGSIIRSLLAGIEQLDITPKSLDALRLSSGWLLGSLQGLLGSIKAGDVDQAIVSARLAVARDAFSPVSTAPSPHFMTEITHQLSIYEQQDSSGWGAAMLPVWKLLRPAVPATLQSLSQLVQLENLVERFDRTSFQFRQPLSSIADVRTSFAKSLARARSGDADIGQLVEQLESIIPTEREEQSLPAPHFSKVFADLSRHFTVLGLSGRPAQALEQARLQALARHPTRWSAGWGLEDRKAQLTAREVLDVLQSATSQAAGTGETSCIAAALLRQLGDKQDVTIARLDLLDSETEVLGHTIASNPHVILEGRVESLDHGLRTITSELLRTLAQGLEDPNMRVGAQMMHDALQQGNHLSLQQQLRLPNAPAVMNDLAFAAVYISKPPTELPDRLSAASRAWLALAVACFRLYLPARQYDPALRPLVKRQVHQSIQDDLSAQLEALRLFTVALTGQKRTLRIRLLEHNLANLGPLPDAPAVCRPASSELAQLQMEFDGLRRVVEHASVNPATGLDEGVLANIQQIRTRLTNNYRAYGDLVGPVAGFIDCLQISHSLANEAMTKMNGSQIMPRSAQLVPYSGASLEIWASDRSMTTALSATASQAETMLWLATLAARSVIWPLSKASVELHRQSGHQFARLYDKWRMELSHDQRQEATKSSLYRYSGNADLQDDPSPDDLHQLFPSAEAEVANTSTDALKARVHELAPRIVQLHHDLYCGGRLTPDTVFDVLDESARVLSSGEYSPPMKTVLPTIMSQLNQLANSLAGRSSESRLYNIYRDTNMQEIRKLLRLVQRIRSRFEELHTVWPDHATPGEVILLCEQLLAASHTETLIRRLPLVEKLHSTIDEWQKIASREYSAASLMESLTDLIVSWRQLELSSWAGLFDDEDRRTKSDAASWWFIAYETIIAATESLPQSDAETARHVTGLLKALEDFFHSSGLGEYHARLEMLRNFDRQLQLRSNDSLAFAHVQQGLSNFVSYFARFESAVHEALINGRSALEKEVKDVIQLASWKDRNIETLRQSSKASHRKLFKSVRKYRALLAQPVGPILQSSMPDTMTILSEAATRELASLPLLQKSDHARMNVSLESWKERPARFRNVEATSSLIISKATLVRSPANAAGRIADFMADVKESVVELQKATPKLLTEANKKQVNHLKTRKRRLLAEVLKNIRSMGFQHNLSQDVLDSQASLSQVLSQMDSVATGDANGSRTTTQSHLHQLLQIMFSVREGARKHSDDLTAAEATRCAAYLESMLSLSITQQKAVSGCIRSRSALDRVLGALECFAACEAPGAESSLSSAERAASYSSTAVMLQTCAQLLRMQGQLGGKEYSSVYDRIASVATELRRAGEKLQSSRSLPPGLVSEQQRNLQASTDHLLLTTRQEIKIWQTKKPELGPILAHVEVWLSQSPTAAGHAQNGFRSISADAWTAELFDFLDRVLVAVQRLQKTLPERHADEDEPGWLLRCQRAIEAASIALGADTITDGLARQLERLQHVDITSPATLPALSLVCRAIHPVVQSYAQAYDQVYSGMAELHSQTTRMAYTLGTSFITLVKEGFCSPPEKSQESKQDSGEVETGTGLGEGEGGEDISKDVGADEDLSEAAQEGNSKDKEDQIEDEKDAVDMADQDMEGELGDVETASQNGENDDENAEDQELEEETGDVGDLDDGAVDEKMWDDGQAEQEKEKETDKGKGTAQDKDLSAAAEGEKDETAAETGQNGEIEEEETAGADEEEVSRKEPEDADPHMDQQENLDLPEDMNLEGEKDDKDDLSDMGSMEEGDDLPADTDGQDEHMDDAGDDLAEAEPDVKDEAADAGEKDGEQTQQAGEDAEEEKPEDKMDEDGLLQNKDQEPQDTPADGTVAGEEGSGQDEEQDQAQASGGAQQDDNEADADQAAQAQQESGKQSGSNEAQDQQPTDQSEQSANAPQQSAYKKLGDVLDEWYRQQRQIEAAQQSDKAETEQQQQDVDMANATFEHLPDADAEADTQALGTASADQSGALNEETSRAVNEDRPAEELPFQEGAQDEEEAAGGNDQQEPHMEPSDQLPQSRDAKAFIGEQAADQDVEMGDDTVSAENEHDVDEVDSQMLRTQISPDNQAEEMTIEEARRTWADHEASTRNLALVLIEHLRLILQPTQATKMRGDFRTGKRLNIKRIIPYIASSYKRDKIWMRRSIPSKRSYQIMLAIDDSKSMDESASKSLAFETLALVAKSMSMLEVGELAVLGFGETTKLAHDFSQPFTSEAGAEVFKSFTFAQSKTNVRKLLEDSIELFRSARLKATGSASELWQLQLIISDGVCEDHPSIRQLVRQAHEERIMIVFIVVDSTAGGASSSVQMQQKKQSIVDLQTAEFSKDESGEMQLKMVKYLDTFPFRYYLIVRDVQELPGVLAGALRQWFSEVVETGGV